MTSIIQLSLFLSAGLSWAPLGLAEVLTTPRLRSDGPWIQYTEQFGVQVLPGVSILTGHDLKPFQTQFQMPELADPYVTVAKDHAVISGTAQYYLKFKSLDDLRRAGPYQVIWNDFYYHDGTLMEGDRYYSHSWDMKPVLWSQNSQIPRLWDPAKDAKPPLMIWYGGHMRPRDGRTTSRWPEDNFSRDVFAFVEKIPGKWFSLKDSIFTARKDWPRTPGSFMGHRYGHQIIMRNGVPTIFYEEVTEVTKDGAPAVTKLFMDEMVNPYQVRGKPFELVSPINPKTGKVYPSALRENGSVLMEGPLYFRFQFEGEDWEAIGFSAGSYYGKYPAAFASRKVKDGLKGKPFQLDLNDQGTDLNDAGEKLGKVLNLAGGPGRPAVIVRSNGRAALSRQGTLQVLVHGYRRDILPDHEYEKLPVKYSFDQMFRITVYAHLKVKRASHGGLRFEIIAPQDQLPKWKQIPETQASVQQTPALRRYEHCGGVKHAATTKTCAPIPKDSRASI